ncbi:MAG TPA: carbohydrate kinase family protein [Streptosporangiaceae bacterium]|nr:carbohydrate kinase family protein [Streptosporangiaceae bacterium]HYA49884.1 carbohydrate kinase family protein [Streptosporangiaceae bacterium]
MDLIAFGTMFLEIVFGDVPSLPAPGEEIFADEFAISCGGAVTAASAASRMGVRAGLSTLLGEDLGSRVVEEYCHRAGVDLSASQRVTGPAAGITVVVNYAGDRAFISYLPPRAQTESREHERWREVLRQVRPAWCYLHAHRGMAGLIREARGLGIRVAVDVGLNEIAADPAAVLACARLADLFLPNTEELLRLTGAGSLDTAIGIAESWGPPVIVKRGGSGAIVAGQPGQAGQTEVTEGIKQVRVRDRTGAGDAFAGALIGALCQGASLAEAVAAGNAAGSDTVSRLGAVGEVNVEGLSSAASAVAAAAVTMAAGERAARADRDMLDGQLARPDNRAAGQDPP